MDICAVSSFDSYLNTIRNIPQLSMEEEYRLADDYQLTGNLKSAQKLVLHNLRFVVHIAKDYLGYDKPMADLVQEGNLGLMHAVKKFKTSFGVRLVSFAAYHIKSKIVEFVIKNECIANIATTKPQKKLFFNLRKMLGAYELTEGKANEISKRLEVPKKDVFEMYGRLTNEDQVVFDESNIAGLTSDLSDVEDHSHLYKCLDLLNGREKDIIISRHLLEEPIKLQELAEKYNVSFQRIKQIENDALRKLRGLCEAG